MDTITQKDVEYKAAGRQNVDQFMPGDLIGANADLLILKSEPIANEPDEWSLQWRSFTTSEDTDWKGLRTSSDARYVPAMYVIEETP